MNWAFRSSLVVSVGCLWAGLAAAAAPVPAAGGPARAAVPADGVIRLTDYG